MHILGRVESILFVASKPLSLAVISRSLGVDEVAVEEALETLKMKYNRDDSGIQILSEGDSVLMSTNPEFHDVVEKFVKAEISEELTKAQLETLTVVAYRGPVTRPELEQIRGVNCSLILRTLLMRGLIEEKETKESLMPQYTVSFEALQRLGIHSVSELPEYETLHSHEHIEQILQANDSAE